MVNENTKCQMCGDPKADRSFNLFFGLHMVPISYDVCLSCRSKVMHNPGSFEVVVRPKGAASGGEVGFGRPHGSPAPPIEAKTDWCVHTSTLESEAANNNDFGVSGEKDRCIRCGNTVGTFKYCPSSAPMKPGSPCLAPRKYLNEKEVNPELGHLYINSIDTETETADITLEPKPDVEYTTPSIVMPRKVYDDGQGGCAKCHNPLVIDTVGSTCSHCGHDGSVPPNLPDDEEIVIITPLTLLSADEAKALLVFEEDPDEERYVEHIDGHE